jgi:hypothetical protein
MKKLMLFIFLLSTSILTAQNVDFKLNEDICYCSGGSPISIVKMDNNWELLLVLRQSKNMTQLDSLGVKYTLSQLKLLQEFDLIQKDKDDFYKTSIVLLDSIRSKSLRNYSKQLSFDLTGEIKPKVLELKSHLQKTKREKNIYSILFSYIIDGMIWDYMEKEGLIDKREISLQRPFWDGEFWMLYPKRDFSCGTNSLSDKGYSIKVNWSEVAIPQMIPFITRFDLQVKILDDFINKGKLEDKEAIAVFGKYNFFDSDGNFTVPIIVENEQDKIYSISQEISSNIISFIKSRIDLEILKNTYDFKDSSQAIVILYHEMIWDIMSALEKESIIEKPIAFKNPEQTKPHDIGDLIILVKK